MRVFGSCHTLVKNLSNGLSNNAAAPEKDGLLLQPAEESLTVFSQ